MMLGFVVRRCAVAVGHEPSAEEFAHWANNYAQNEESFCLFGRPISVNEARIILRHRGRPVSARGAAAHEVLTEIDDADLGNVVSLAAARLRRNGRR
jgi:hypothetical protein